MRHSSFLLVLLVLTALAFTGCSDDDSGSPEIRNLEVRQTFPEDGAQDVNLNPLVQVWFSQPLDEASIVGDCVRVEGAETRRLHCDARARYVCLYLTRPLEPDSTYRVVIERSIRSAAGDDMSSDAEFEFTTTGDVDCAHLADYFEPNDDIFTAPEIELDTYYTCLSSCGGDERKDFFRFTTEDTVMISAIAKHSESWGDTVDFVVNLARADGAYYYEVHSALAANWGVNNDHTFLPGTYLVEVGNHYDDGKLLVYCLVLTSKTPCEDDIYEDNDFLDEAAPISPGLYENLGGCIADKDYFALELNEGQILSGVITQVTDILAGRYIRILDPSGAEVASESLYGRQEPISTSWTALDDGTHFMCICWGNYGIKYDLDIQVTQ